MQTKTVTVNMSDALARDLGQCSGCRHLVFKYIDNYGFMKASPFCLHPRIGDEQIPTNKNSSVLTTPCNRLSFPKPPGWETI